jgi:hypothetical protein
MFSDIQDEYSEMHSNHKRYGQVGDIRKKQREMKNVKRLVAGTSPRTNINQPVSGRMDRDFDFALSSIYDGDSSFAEYSGTVEASGFAEYPTEQFPVDECQQTLHMSTSNKMAMALERIRQQQQQVFIGVLVYDFVLCACI